MTTPEGPPPLLRLQRVSRVFHGAGSPVRAVDDVTLDIRAGELVAIVGQSGSGKSTLMNLLGCLDRPSSGVYEARGTDVSQLDPDDLARLRREMFGFVFQRYNLLASMSAAENVELPAIYAGLPKSARQERARALLSRLGLSDRLDHPPSKLSGGQQQRVSLARALMNGADVILADEPTGALDSRSGAEVLDLLVELNAQGRTVILITHDMEVARHAHRVIRLLDGRVVEDTGPLGDAADGREHEPAHGDADWLGEIGEAVKMALRSLRSNLFRSALTLLGVVIGVAAVVAMLAIGNGSKQSVMDRLASMGTNLVLVFPGAPGSRPGGDEMATLMASDAEALKEVADVKAVSPERRERKTLRYGNLDYQTTVTGAWPEYVLMQDWRLQHGSFFTREDLDSYAAVVVLGKTVADNLFPNGDAVGKFMLVGQIPFEVIGVLAPKGANAFGSDMDDTALVPLTTGFVRLFGKQHLNIINVKIASAEGSERVQESVRTLLLARHGTQDFQARSTQSLMEMAASTQDTLTWMLGAVAAISLLVGGIGVMNIMLVNVTERTREIGVRIAVGARTRNILMQFNTEALVVCGFGGFVGVLLGLLAGAVVEAFGTPVVFTVVPVVMAFGSAFLTGVSFGYLPARKAAHMDPVQALATE